ncbi:flagellar basal body P-ring formation chaperone FlgA [Paragemmobacter ruber]|uniref:Flagella basal body P-ring formation protein FlgA n=1 Tax=Paragemmobacter ruber TaxID=1985673 RepID=A0ABW9Y4B4_9RHOB|nr:flagellar basal body P-ring formation chaperone FlgA [Rhodobacter ruber]NBE07381.1 flagellar basal body P-ring formation protein FlgA [Rhodobacter ruber]
MKAESVLACLISLFGSATIGALAAQGAESLVATRVIAAQSTLSSADMAVVEAAIPGALVDPAQAIGLQARRTIYPGRPILASDVGPPILIGRNAIVQMRYLRGGLEIAAEGRALDKGGAGEVIRVISLGSKTVVSGRVMADGNVAVGDDACAGC